MNKGFQLLFKHIPSGQNNENDTVTLTGTIEQFEKAMDEYATLKNIESSSRIMQADRCLLEAFRKWHYKEDRAWLTHEQYMKCVDDFLASNGA